MNLLLSEVCLVSLFAREALSSAHYAQTFINLLTFIELYFNGNSMGLDGLGQI